MIHPDLIKKIKQIEIKTNKIVDNLFGGEYHSALKGLGMEFSEVREYIHGDDIKDIDWNVTARTSRPHIKKYEEERELVVILAVDVSGSTYYGTGNSLKNDLIIELSSILSFSAIKNNDKVGLLLFSDCVEKFIPPQKGKSHVLRLIRDIIHHPYKDTQTNIKSSLTHILRVLKRRSIIFLISDFMDNNYKHTIKLINRKHDLINIKLIDKSELSIPNIGFVKLSDVETQQEVWINTNNKNHRKIYRNHIEKTILNFNNFCNKNNIDFININTHEGYIKPLETFFNNRKLK